jgi:hypothetical protein
MIRLLIGEQHLILIVTNHSLLLDFVDKISWNLIRIPGYKDSYGVILHIESATRQKKGTSFSLKSKIYTQFENTYLFDDHSLRPLRNIASYRCPHAQRCGNASHIGPR